MKANQSVSRQLLSLAGAIERADHLTAAAFAVASHAEMIGECRTISATLETAISTLFGVGVHPVYDLQKIAEMIGAFEEFWGMPLDEANAAFELAFAADAANRESLDECLRRLGVKVAPDDDDAVVEADEEGETDDEDTPREGSLFEALGIASMSRSRTLPYRDDNGDESFAVVEDGVEAEPGDLVLVAHDGINVVEPFVVDAAGHASAPLVRAVIAPTRRSLESVAVDGGR